MATFSKRSICSVLSAQVQDSQWRRGAAQTLPRCCSSNLRVPHRSILHVAVSVRAFIAALPFCALRWGSLMAKYCSSPSASSQN